MSKSTERRWGRTLAIWSGVVVVGLAIYVAFSVWRDSLPGKG